METHSAKHGFTLLEVLVAAAIILVLSAVGVSSYVSVSQKSRDARRTADLEQLRQALEMYRSENGTYPAVSVGSWTNVSNLGVLVPNFMPRLPVDPKGGVYQYRAANSAYQYCLATQLETNTTAVNECGASVSMPNSTYDYAVSNP